jgi:hypothetical protein
VEKEFMGHIERIDFEPKTDLVGVTQIYAHVFFKNDAGTEIDMYTLDPRLEAGLLKVFDPLLPEPPILIVQYVEVGTENRLHRVTLYRNPSPDAKSQRESA